MRKNTRSSRYNLKKSPKQWLLSNKIFCLVVFSRYFRNYSHLSDSIPASAL